MYRDENVCVYLSHQVSMDRVSPWATSRPCEALSYIYCTKNGISLYFLFSSYEL